MQYIPPLALQFVQMRESTVYEWHTLVFTWLWHANTYALHFWVLWVIPPFVVAFPWPWKKFVCSTKDMFSKSSVMLCRWCSGCWTSPQTTGGSTCLPWRTLSPYRLPSSAQLRPLLLLPSPLPPLPNRDLVYTVHCIYIPFICCILLVIYTRPSFRGI